MTRFVLMTILTLMVVASVFAQPAPNAPANPPGAGQRGNRPGNMQGMMGGMQPEAVMEVTPQGLFVLREGILAKFDPQTLKQLGTLELFGPAPARPQMPDNPTDQDRQAMRTWMMTMAPRMAPAAVLRTDDMLLIVQGNNFFRVNQKTLALDATQTELVKRDAANPMQAMMAMMAKPVLQLTGKTLYILLGDQLVALNIDDGTVTSRGTLPKEMMQQIMGGGMGGMFGRGGGGAGGRGGAGGGARRNQNQPQQ